MPTLTVSILCTHCTHSNAIPCPESESSRVKRLQEAMKHRFKIHTGKNACATCQKGNRLHSGAFFNSINQVVQWVKRLKHASEPCGSCLPACLVLHRVDGFALRTN